MIRVYAESTGAKVPAGPTSVQGKIYATGGRTSLSGGPQSNPTRPGRGYGIGYVPATKVVRRGRG